MLETRNIATWRSFRYLCGIGEGVGRSDNRTALVLGPNPTENGRARSGPAPRTVLNDRFNQSFADPHPIDGNFVSLAWGFFDLGTFILLLAWEEWELELGLAAADPQEVQHVGGQGRVQVPILPRRAAG